MSRPSKPKGKVTVHIEGGDFLRRAFEKVRPQIKRDIKRAIRDAMK